MTDPTNREALEQAVRSLRETYLAALAAATGPTKTEIEDETQRGIKGAIAAAVAKQAFPVMVARARYEEALGQLHALRDRETQERADAAQTRAEAAQERSEVIQKQMTCATGWIAVFTVVLALIGGAGLLISCCGHHAP